MSRIEDITIDEMLALEECLSRLTLTTLVALGLHGLAAALRVRPAPYPSKETPTT